MRSRILGLILLLLLPISLPVTASAETGSPVIIKQVQLDGSSDLKDSIVLYNQTAQDVSLTGWAIEYARANTNDHESLDPAYCGAANWQTYATVATDVRVTEIGGVLPAFNQARITGLDLDNFSGGSIRVITKFVDGVSTQADLVGWGSDVSRAPCFEAAQAAIPETDFSLVRQKLVHQYSDTNNNATDFTITHSSTVVDDSDGSCDEDCEEPEEPASEPVEQQLPLIINEVLPDPKSPQTDDQHEFIEIYNPNDSAVNMHQYLLQTGANLQYMHEIENLTIQAKGYVTLFSASTGLVLGNNAGGVRLTAADGSISSEMSYTTTNEGASWSLIDGDWVMTAMPTPNAANSRPVANELQTATEEVSVALCATGKERNNTTGRCKTINTTTASVPCEAGQERNPATQRCRRTDAVLVGGSLACKSGEVRNPLTNRCKKQDVIVQAAAQPCKSDQERNAKTNRCRKVETGSSITTPARIDPAKTAQQNILTMSTPLGWGIASFAVVGVLGYGLFEWRSEAMVAIGRMRNFFNSTK